MTDLLCSSSLETSPGVLCLPVLHPFWVMRGGEKSVGQVATSFFQGRDQWRGWGSSRYHGAGSGVEEGSPPAPRGSRLTAFGLQHCGAGS